MEHTGFLLVMIARRCFPQKIRQKQKNQNRTSIALFLMHRILSWNSIEKDSHDRTAPSTLSTSIAWNASFLYSMALPEIRYAASAVWHRPGHQGWRPSACILRVGCSARTTVPAYISPQIPTLSLCEVCHTSIVCFFFTEVVMREKGGCVADFVEMAVMVSVATVEWQKCLRFLRLSGKLQSERKKTTCLIARWTAMGHRKTGWGREGNGTVVSL